MKKYEAQIEALEESVRPKVTKYVLKMIKIGFVITSVDNIAIRYFNRSMNLSAYPINMIEDCDE